MQELPGATRSSSTPSCSCPSCSTAFDERLGAPGAPAELAALAGEARIAEAIGRLADWDFSTPTGIAEGYDARDVDRHPHAGRSPSPGERSAQRRGHDLQPVARLGDPHDRRRAAQLASASRRRRRREALKALHHLLAQSPYTGVGAAGLRLDPASPPRSRPSERRDLALLAALRDALDALASPDVRAGLRPLDRPERLPLGQAAPHRVRPPASIGAASASRRRPASRTCRRSCAGSRATAATRW